MKLKGMISLALAGLFFFSCVSAPEEGTDAAPQADTEVKKNNADTEEFKTEIVRYYVASRESYFLDDGTENGYKEYELDPQGKLLSMVNYKGSGDLLFEEKYLYGTSGELVKSELYDSEGLTSYTVFTYSGGEIPTGEEYYNHKDVYRSGSRFEYDSQGRKILWESLDDNKSLVLKAEYEYDGDLLEKVQFLTPLGKDDGFLAYEYNKDVLVKESSTNGQGKEERRTEYEYDSDFLVKTRIYQLGRLSRVNEMEYDNEGNLVLMTTYNRMGKLLGSTRYDYESYEKEIQVLVE